MTYAFSFLFAGAALAMLVPEVAAQGHHSAALRRIIIRTAGGTCPADMIQPKLMKACKQQIAKSGPPLAAKGPIKALTFIKADRTGQRTEFYKVTFEKGKSEIWTLAD